MRVIVAFATETGNAQVLAEKLFIRLRLHAVQPDNVLLTSVAHLDEDDWLFDDNTLVVYVVSTTGEGEVPLSMRPFWTKLLRSQLTNDFLTSAAFFTIFGLGDSSYEKFNAAARKLRARFMQLGAREFCTNGSGDEQVDTELAFDRWSDTLLQSLLDRDASAWMPDERPLEPPSKFSVSLLDGADTGGVNHEIRCGDLIQISQIDRLTAPDWNQDVRHVEFDAAAVKYESGDAINIWPTLDEAMVATFIKTKLPDVDPDRPFACNPQHPHLPKVTTVRQAFTQFLDLCAVPSRFFFRQAAPFCSSPEEQEKMLEMASAHPDNAASYTLYCKRERRTYDEVLRDFETCRIPLSALLELIPPLRPRAYSISSSPLAHPGKVHITVALLEYITPYKRRKIGTCSAFLRRLGDRPHSQLPLVRAYISCGALQLPLDLTVPLILIGTGTGCAPMRSLMHERARLTSSLPNKNVRFYFGCRSPDADFLYKDEWPLICDDLMVAFSKRDNKRVPVLLARDAKWIFEALTEQNAYLYVSGSAKRMPADVRETLVQILVNEGEVKREIAIKLISRLEKERRYIVEAWS